MIRRYADWQPRLEAFLAEVGARPRALPGWDCMLFAAGAVKAMTGHDFARGLRGYRAEREGLKRLKNKGYRKPRDLLVAHLEPSNQVTAGDVVLFDGEGKLPAPGIVQSARFFYAVGPDGVYPAPMSLMIEGFKIHGP